MTKSTTKVFHRSFLRWPRSTASPVRSILRSSPLLLIMMMMMMIMMISSSGCVAALPQSGDATTTTSNITTKQQQQQQQQKEQKQQTGGIRWRNLSITLSPQRRRRLFTKPFQNKSLSQSLPLQLLHPCWGSVSNGSICGILGPSGSGKSTFLAALSGTTISSSSTSSTGGVGGWFGAGREKRVGGSVWLERMVQDDEDGTRMRVEKSFLSVSKGEVAQLQQHDAFFSMLTPRETVDLAAYLQLGREWKRTERTALVDSILDSLGLRNVEHRQIGATDGAGGLSGGERRRLSVALELVTNPKVFFADEPTTGLDSAQSQKVVDLMKKLAIERDIPCICSLHQPRASIWKALDSFILLAPGGRVIYMGDRKSAVSYFANLGYECPSDTNPAEFYIDLVTIDTEDPDRAAQDQKRIDNLSKAFASRMKNATTEHDGCGGEEMIWIPPPSGASPLVENDSGKRKLRRRRRPFHERFAVLFLRSLRQNLRDVRTNLIRLGASFGLAVLFSELFPTVRKRHDSPLFSSLSSPSSSNSPHALTPRAPPKQKQSMAKTVADRTALLSFGVINMTMLALSKTLVLFSTEKHAVTRERIRRQYSGWDYAAAKTASELPLDASFAAVFAVVLSGLTKLRMGAGRLAAVFSTATAAAATMGFAVGSLVAGEEEALIVGMSLAAVLMAVGVINPGGVDPTASTPKLIQFLQRASPIRLAIEALCVAEYRGMKFDEEGGGGGGGWRSMLKDLPRMGGLALVKNGDQVLEALGLADKSYGNITRDLATLSIINLILCWLGLEFGGPQFVVADANGTDEEDDGISSKQDDSCEWDGVDDDEGEEKEDKWNSHGSSAKTIQSGVAIPLVRTV